MNLKQSGILIVAAAACLVFVFSSPSALIAADTQAAPKQFQPQAWGYQPWWMQQNWPTLQLGHWHRTIFFELQVEADGQIGNFDDLPPGWRSMRHSAARCGSAFDLAFTLFDEQQFEQIFTSAPSRDRLMHNILDLADSASADGVHLDFEVYNPVSAASVAGFRAFLKQLRAAMRRAEKTRVLSIFGVVGAQQDILDRETLSLADFVVIQGYDAHWPGSAVAGSVAPLKGRHPLTWEESLRHYLDMGAERSRLLFSIPYFGYEWQVKTNEKGSPTTGRGKETTYAPLPAQWVPSIAHAALTQSERHGVLRDPETGSPYYVYRNDDGNWIQGWFEDETSLAEKFAFVKREKLAGVAAFPLGYDAGKFEPLVAAAFGKRPDCQPAGHVE